MTLSDQISKLDLSHLNQREASEILNIFLDLESLIKRLDNLPDDNIRISKRKLKKTNNSILQQNLLNCDSTYCFNGSMDNIFIQTKERCQNRIINQTKVVKLKKHTIKKTKQQKK